MKNSNSSHEVVDGRNGGQEMMDKVTNGKTPNNHNGSYSTSYSSLPPEVAGQGQREGGETETAETEERRRAAQRVFNKQG